MSFNATSHPSIDIKTEGNVLQENAAHLSNPETAKKGKSKKKKKQKEEADPSSVMNAADISNVGSGSNIQARDGDSGGGVGAKGPSGAKANKQRDRGGATSMQQQPSSTVNGGKSLLPSQHNVSSKKKKKKANAVSNEEIPTTLWHAHCVPDSKQHQEANSKKRIFLDHLTCGKVDHRLLHGQLKQGVIRINPKNHLDAYVPPVDGGHDVYIRGVAARNRALNGDYVAIKIYPKEQWMVQVSQVEAATNTEIKVADPQTNSRPTLSEYLRTVFTAKQFPQKHMKAAIERGSIAFKEQYLQRTGEVVHILERRHSRICTGCLSKLENNNRLVKFSPLDHRIPRLILEMNSCPKGFNERPQDFASTLFIAKILEWNVYQHMPKGEFCRTLGETGDIEPETEGILIENEVDCSDFPDDVLQCLPQSLPWTIPPHEFSYRRDFRKECVFTIDPVTARDLDDAVSCVDLGDGIYEVGVHIADVSFFIPEDSALDKMAASRSTSVYMVQRVIHMLPRLLCEELCSLNPDIDRLTFSVVWKMTEHGEILEEWFGRSIIRSCAKLSYQHAQGFIDEPNKQWTTAELPPIAEGFTVDMIHRRVLKLDKIAKNLRKNRFDSGALRLDQVKIQFTLDPDSGLPNGYYVYKQQDSNRLIEEYMLLANMAVATKIYKTYPEYAVLRRHPPPKEKSLGDLQVLSDALGVQLDTSSAGTLQASIAALSGEDFTSSAQTQVLVVLCSKPMQNALYFCSGALSDEHQYRHYALNVPLYTHFTSPIRRYPDILVHRLLAASLEYTQRPAVSAAEVEQQCRYSNKKKENARICSMSSNELYFNTFVKECGPLYEQGMVMDVLNKSFDVLILRLGVVKRVYCEMLPLYSFTFYKQKTVPNLSLTWEKGRVNQVISIFSNVNCILRPGDKPLKVQTLIRHPNEAVQDDAPTLDGSLTPTAGPLTQTPPTTGASVTTQQPTLAATAAAAATAASMAEATADTTAIATEDDSTNDNNVTAVATSDDSTDDNNANENNDSSWTGVTTDSFDDSVIDSEDEGPDVVVESSITDSDMSETSDMDVCELIIGDHDNEDVIAQNLANMSVQCQDSRNGST